MKIAAALVLAISTAALAENASIYTPLSGNSCKLVKEDKETGSTLHSCPGPSPRIRTAVAYDDQRMSISLLFPEEVPLNLWSVVTRSFSSLSSKAEWRVARNRGTVALIVRVNATDSEGRKTASLAVAKINPDAKQACVIEVIPATLPNANSQARQSADQSENKPCLTGDQK